MLKKIKRRIERELAGFTRNIDKSYHLGKASPLLLKEIKGFILRRGKRLRPALFAAAYMGFAGKPCPGLYRGALSMELLHDFMLIHDDIIDRSPTRRGKPSIHKKMGAYLSRYKNVRFNGEDLSIIAGDLVYAMAIGAFLSIDEDRRRKEAAMKEFIGAAISTACGEFAELVGGLKSIKDTTKQDIYKIYDLKTARYSFACPMAAGAILAGADKTDSDRLFKGGIYIGRAFQIKDDILGLMGKEKETGKSTLTDLSEGKKTLLIWHAYNNSAKCDAEFIKKSLGDPGINRAGLLKVRKIIRSAGSEDYAKKETDRLLENAYDLYARCGMAKKYKNALCDYFSRLMSV